MIPDIVHYIHLSDPITNRSWQLHHYLSVKSAYLRSGCSKIYVWVNEKPLGEWWDLTEPMVEVHTIIPPQEIFGKPITQPAHKSDVLRLQILLAYGGIYVDTDTIFVKSFQSLLDNKFVLGQQNINGSEGLCPAVILSEKNAVFAQNWLAGFKDTFFGGPPGSDTWCTHSVIYPVWLAKQIPEEITILDHEAFFWPLYHQPHMEMLFEQNHTYPHAYSHHLWESSGKQYLCNLTVDYIKTTDTSFTNLVKDLL